jgi:hypothetical protein
VYRQRAREEGRLFPQVKVFRVKALPIAVGSKKQQRLIEELVGVLEGRSLKESVQKELMMNLNQAVYEIYGLNKDEIKLIEREE